MKRKVATAATIRDNRAMVRHADPRLATRTRLWLAALLWLAAPQAAEAQFDGDPARMGYRYGIDAAHATGVDDGKGIT